LANGESALAKPRNPSGLYVLALSIYVVASGNGATDHEETARCEATKRRRKEEKAEEYLTSQVLAVVMPIAYDYVTPSKSR